MFHSVVLMENMVEFIFIHVELLVLEFSLKQTLTEFLHFFAESSQYAG